MQKPKVQQQNHNYAHELPAKESSKQNTSKDTVKAIEASAATAAAASFTAALTAAHSMKDTGSIKERVLSSKQPSTSTFAATPRDEDSTECKLTPRPLLKLTLSALASALLTIMPLTQEAMAVSFSEDNLKDIVQQTKDGNLSDVSSLMDAPEEKDKEQLLAEHSSNYQRQFDAGKRSLNPEKHPLIDNDYGSQQINPTERPKLVPDWSGTTPHQQTLLADSTAPTMIGTRHQAPSNLTASLSPVSPMDEDTQLFAYSELAAASNLAANQAQLASMTYSPERNRSSVHGMAQSYTALNRASARTSNLSTPRAIANSAPRAALTAKAATATAARTAATARASATATASAASSAAARAALTAKEQPVVRVRKSVTRTSPMTLNKINLLSTARTESPEVIKGAQQSLTNLLGRPIDAQLLNRVLNQVTTYYRQEQGLTMAKAYLPAQSITNGELELVVASPTMDKVDIVNASRTSDEYLNYLLSDLKAQEGKPINHEELQSILLRLSDAGVIHLIGGMRALNESATSQELRLGVLDFYHPLAFSLFADNYGSETSGRYRFGGQLQVTNLLGLADKLSLFYARSDEQQNNYGINYELPVSPHGTVVGVDFSYNDYDLGGWYKALGAQGYSYTIEGYVKEPLYRDPITSVNLRAGLRYRDLEDEFSNFDLTFKKHSWLGYAEFNGFKFFGARQQHVFSFMQRFSWGHLTNDDEWGLWEDQDYLLSNTNLNFRYAFNRHFISETDLTMQLADNALEGSEQFSASGPFGLKAFSAADLTGDAGVVLSQKLEISPWEREIFNIVPHIEIGHVDNKDYKGDSGTSAGLTLHYKTKFGLNLELDYSHTIGPRPDFAEDNGRLNFTVSYFYI